MSKKDPKPVRQFVDDLKAAGVPEAKIKKRRGKNWTVVHTEPKGQTPEAKAEFAKLMGILGDFLDETAP